MGGEQFACCTIGVPHDLFDYFVLATQGGAYHIECLNSVIRSLQDTHELDFLSSFAE